jgi:uncharacterized protein YkwD
MRFRSIIVLVLCCALAVTADTQSADAGRRAHKYRSRMIELVNDSRARHGVRRLKLNTSLSQDAWRHSLRMARRRRLFHTYDLSSLVHQYRPSYWGENVGVARTLRKMEKLFMGSAPHRANILNGHYRHAGIGVVRTGGRLWVTIIFYGG